MRLTGLLATLSGVTVAGPFDFEAEITGIAYDSRAVQPGQLFVALPGAHVDGQRFIGAAIARGAAAALCQESPSSVLPVPHVLAPNARAALADLAAAFHGHPSRRLRVVGVTGTDGKSTTCYLLHTLLQATGRAAGLSSTVAFRVGDRAWRNPLGLTTPQAPDLQRLLAEMVTAGVDYAVIEASSHALVLDRLRGCYIDVGILTNITSDHLDFHGTLERYREAKALLFRCLGTCSKQGIAPLAILNRDDSSYAAMRAASAAPVLSYGLHPTADVRARDAFVSAEGIRFRATTPAGEVMVETPLLGRFHVHNLLAALTFAVAQKIPLVEAAAALATMTGVPGRMRRVDAGQPYTVVVDYAHTPDALTKVLDDLRGLTRGRLIAVFGAPGERDRTKRPVMGRIAAARCDAVILTDDEPRGEDRHAIIEEIAVGARPPGRHYPAGRQGTRALHYHGR